MNILFIGDLVSANAIEVVAEALRKLRQVYTIDGVVANGENIHAHNGINGRYCNMFKKYVEYMQSPICINKKL